MRIEQHANRNAVVRCLEPYMMDRMMASELGEHPTWSDGDTYFCISIGGAVVSFACLSGTGKLRYVYTAPSHRKNGYFSTLIQIVEEHALSVGVKRISATATDAAIDHYTKRGYRITNSWKKYHNIEKHLGDEPISAAGN